MDWSRPSFTPESCKLKQERMVVHGYDVKYIWSGPSFWSKFKFVLPGLLGILIFNLRNIKVVAFSTKYEILSFECDQIEKILIPKLAFTFQWFQGAKDLFFKP